MMLGTPLSLLQIAPAHYSNAPTTADIAAGTSSLATWIFTRLDSAADVGNDTSIALDHDDKVHISYYDSTNRDLKYVTNAGGEWANYTIDSASDVGQYTSIAVDSNGSVHISYFDWTNGDLKYATNAGGVWRTQTVDSAGTTGLFTSIAVDSSDNVHISYLDATNYDLRYATNSNGSWAYYTIDSAGDVGFDTSIAVDSLDNVHISYGDWTNEDLKYATNEGGSWASYTIDSEGSVGFDTSIAVDSGNGVHISYLDDSNASLKYATNTAGSWAVYTLDTEGDVGLSTSIALDSEDKVHISYCDFSDFGDRDLKYATNAGGSWAYYTIFSAGDVGFDTSIAVDEHGLVHMSFSDYTNYDLMYARGTAADVPPLVVSIYAEHAPGQTPLTFQFSANVSGGVPPYVFSWTFGDGGVSSSQYPLHTYAGAGTYVVTVLVTDQLSTSKLVESKMAVSSRTIVPITGDANAALLTVAFVAVVGLLIAAALTLVMVRRKAQASERSRAPDAVERTTSVDHLEKARIPQVRGEPTAAQMKESVGATGPFLGSVERRLFRLREMKEKGLISEEEYDEQVKALIRRW